MNTVTIDHAGRPDSEGRRYDDVIELEFTATKVILVRGLTTHHIELPVGRVECNKDS